MTAPLGEFDLIARYFTRPVRRAALGVGDDCALLAAPAANEQIAISSDMLVEGRHFLPGADSVALGHKALAVNLSDLAAVGARPHAFTLALALPEADPRWLEGFARGLFALAEGHDIELVGGDTTRGPRNLCITVLGLVPRGQALLRSGARPGDDLWVSGTVGDARLALGHRLGQWTLDAQTQALLRASRVGATVDADACPASAALAAQPLQRRRLCQLAGGDDYELLFTAPPTARNAVAAAAAQAATPVTRIGRIDAEPGLRLIDASGQVLDNVYAGFEHFRTP
ncbi:thiamine-monophosphate kinase [Thiomonas sp. 13-64-67]|uniref:thiamine-phosphate kinase n=1 Tax=Thiomonas sp. 13-64-67 TaxID=1970447 RepID=UPI000BC829B8|nr:thiamine-monophosphate kinase [Thiomonas sp. 13-64-67]OZB69449.1 MAG: thiamine-phosphate kinase [Thiomonas sp. 13-64-67]